MEAEISMGKAMARVFKLSKLNNPGKRDLNLEWEKNRKLGKLVKWSF